MYHQPHVDVKLVYAVPIEMVPSVSLMCTRALMLKPNTRPTGPKTTGTIITRRASTKLPGHETFDDWDAHLDDANERPVVPFTETEADLATLDEEALALYKLVRAAMSGDHSGEILDHYHYLVIEGAVEVNGERINALEALKEVITQSKFLTVKHILCNDVVTRCFQKAVDVVLPGQGSQFDIEFIRCSGANGHPDEGAGDDGLYIVYKQSVVCAGGDLTLTDSGIINVPWGFKMTPIPRMSEDERKQVDAGLSVIVEKLGFCANGPPNMYLVTDARC